MFTDFMPFNALAGHWDWSSAVVGLVSTLGLRGAPLLSNPLIGDAVKLMLLGSIIETGKRIIQWISERFEPRYFVTASFAPPDETYEWLVNYLMKEKVWDKPRGIYVKSKNLRRKWKFQTTSGTVDYVPHYGPIQIFRWKGYWVEITRTRFGVPYHPNQGEFEPIQGGESDAALTLRIYSFNISVLFDFVEECRSKYLEDTKSAINIFSIRSYEKYYSSREGEDWQKVKSKPRRPLESLVLEERVAESILADAQEFIRMEEWYSEAGIPYHRGYLLYGPPGSGKTSTVFALAGELGLDIYSLSLANGNMDDAFLIRLVSQLPPKAILLIEDIDCAFPSRDEDEIDEDDLPYELRRNQKGSEVTLSGLLNILDGISSEDGKLFFATTNYFNRLDPALIRPGRIDYKVEYTYTTPRQSYALFMRFFHLPKFLASRSLEKSTSHIEALARDFSDAIPENTFSMAEIQGFLLDHKMDPDAALKAVGSWVDQEKRKKHEVELLLQRRKERTLKIARRRRRQREKELEYDSDSGQEDSKDKPASGESHDQSNVPTKTGTETEIEVST